MSQLLPVGKTVAIIDDRDFTRASLHTWYFNRQVFTVIDGKRVTLPRYILCVKGTEKVFYKDGDKYNCRRSNLTKIRVKR